MYLGKYLIGQNAKLILINSQDYNRGQNLYADHFIYDQGSTQSEMHGNDWPDHHSEEEDKSMYEISGRASEDESDVHIRGDEYNAPTHYQQNHIYHLPENFRQYTNGHQQEFNNQHNKIANFVDVKKEHMKVCGLLMGPFSYLMFQYSTTYVVTTIFKLKVL